MHKTSEIEDHLKRRTNQVPTYLSHEIAVSVNTEAEMDKMAMKFEILQ